MSMILYSDVASLESHRVRVILAEKDIPVTIEWVEPDNLPAALVEQNPYGSVPTLVDRDLVLHDSRVIADYLDERYPHPPFLPMDPVSRARTRLTLHRIEKDWYALLPGATDSKANVAARKQLGASLSDSASLFSAMPYFLSEEYSILDATLTPFLWRMKKNGVDLSTLASEVAEYAERMFKRPGFQASMTDTERYMAIDN